MADDSDKLSELAKEVRDQSRFTRTVTVVCTAAVLAGLFYVTTEIFEKLPTMIIASYMENMEPIMKQMRAYEKHVNGAQQAPPKQ
jgi:hypothetical protein